MYGPKTRSVVVAYGDWLFKYRNRVFPVVLFALLLGLPPVAFGGSVAADRWVDLAGLLIACAGQALRVVVIGLEYIKRGGVNKRIHADTLVIGGMFAHCRNPLYVGNLLIFAGLFVIHNNPWVYLLAGTYFGTAYWALVLAEEHFLRGRFGAEYEDYCRRVPRWTLRTDGLGETLRSMRFNWRRVVQKDHGTALYWMMGAVLLAVVERLRSPLPEYAHSSLLPFAAAMLALLAVGVGIRVLKARRFFVQPEA
ncbi:MAG: isoprenylcysteine carboxylmethyltransferase family protein [Gammaproteobacteria bacterium]